MNQTHLHLLITHLPIVGSILGAIVLAYGLWAKTYQAKIPAYILLIISSAGAVIAYLTGEAAEETVENIQGISENMVEQHEEFALIAHIALIALGISSITGLFLAYKKSSFSSGVAWLTFFMAMISFGLVAITGYLGGLIRHTEINSSVATQESQDGQDDD